MNKETRYDAAFKELQEIVNALEEGGISVDDLSEKIKRAVELIRICRKKLNTTEQDVSKILKELGDAG
jgi:exodeoxyribonuclease VII small subunit